jgi:hypothetical protein
MAGIEVNVDFKNADLMRDIQQILLGFDPSVPVPEEEIVFITRSLRSSDRFSKQN